MSKNQFLPPKVRRPREEVKPVARQLEKMGLTVCGSYRRENATVGDLDILVPGILFWDEVLEECRQLLGYQYSRQGPLKSEGVMTFLNSHLLLNFWHVPTTPEWAGMLLYATGPHDLNIMMRARAKSKGWKLANRLTNEEGLQLNYTHNTEQEIFALLDIKYLTPVERSNWRNELADKPNIRVVRVPSSTGSGFYNVTMRNGKAVDCECKGFEYRNKCRHLAEAESAQNKS